MKNSRSLSWGYRLVAECLPSKYNGPSLISVLKNRNKEEMREKKGKKEGMRDGRKEEGRKKGHGK